MPQKFLHELPETPLEGAGALVGDEEVDSERYLRLLHADHVARFARHFHFELGCLEIRDDLILLVGH